MAEQSLLQIQERGTILVDQIRSSQNDSPLIKLVEGWLDRCTKACQVGYSHDTEISIPAVTQSRLSPALTGAQIALRAQQLGPVSDWREILWPQQPKFFLRLTTLSTKRADNDH